MADALAWGAPPEFIAELQAEDTLFAVYPENWPTLLAWSRVDTQWRMGPGGPIGLDNPAVFQTLDRCGIADPDGVIFDGLQTFERAALAAMTKDR